MKIPASIAKIAYENVCNTYFRRGQPDTPEELNAILEPYQKGMEAGFTLAMDRAEKLVKALERVTESYFEEILDSLDVAKHALEEWKKEMK